MNHYQILCTFQGNGAIDVYKKQPNTQLSFDDFNEPVGLTMNPRKSLGQKRRADSIDKTWKSSMPPFSKAKRAMFPSHSAWLLALFLEFKRSMGTQI